MRLLFLKIVVLLLLLATVISIVAWQNNKRSKNEVAKISEVKSPESSKTQEQQVRYEVQEVVSGLEVPWSILFTSENRFLITERPGRIRVVEEGKLLETPLLTLDASSRSEEGLMGLDKDPEYSFNGYIYVSYAYTSSSNLFVKVVRLKDLGDHAEVDQTLIDKIPAATLHAGSRIKFGPDGYLYITTGDATDKNSAQDPNQLSGKILRITKDGKIPDDNPISDSPIYTLGHRNPQGISWFVDGTMVSTEHGPSGFDGPLGGDEINVIISGKNYGWPVVSHDKKDDRFESPKETFTPAVAPSGALVYSGKLFPQFKEVLFFAGLRGEGLYTATFNSSHNKIIDTGKIEETNFGRIREVVEAPNGEIFFATSNRDGRGSVRKGDDKIYKITPAK